MMLTKQQSKKLYKDSDVRAKAIQHPNVTPEHISKALNGEDRYVRVKAIQHPKATSEHISKALSDKDSDVRDAAERRYKSNSNNKKPKVGKVSKVGMDKLKDLHERSAKIHHDHYKLTKDIEQHLKDHPDHQYLLDDNYARKIHHYQGDVTPSMSHNQLSKTLGVKPAKPSK